jgi:hypothetical protein
MDVVPRPFEKAGVEFIDENGGGAGVRLPKPLKLRRSDSCEDETNPNLSMDPNVVLKN